MASKWQSWGNGFPFCWWSRFGQSSHYWQYPWDHMLLEAEYCRFDQHNFTLERQELISDLATMSLTTAAQAAVPGSQWLLPFQCEVVLDKPAVLASPWTHLEENKPKQSTWAWPDLWSSAEGRCSQLSGVLCKLFNRSLAKHSIYDMEILYYLSSIKKKSNPTCDNDYRPAALTSLVIKSFERLVLCQLQKEVGVHTEPLQFAYKHNRGWLCCFDTAAQC